MRACVRACVSDVLLTQHSMINQRSSLSCLDRRTVPPFFLLFFCPIKLFKLFLVLTSL